jgi:hypothetical protein
MATIQSYPEELNYVLAVLHPKAPKVGSFLMAFCEACQRADWQNYEDLRPALHSFMAKYPCDIQRLAMEQEDSIVPRPSAEADDALGVPREWRETHPFSIDPPNPLDCTCEYVHCSSASCRSKTVSRGALKEKDRLFPAQ